jgi:hypothetical protein
MPTLRNQKQGGWSIARRRTNPLRHVYGILAREQLVPASTFRALGMSNEVRKVITVRLR